MEYEENTNPSERQTSESERNPNQVETHTKPKTQRMEYEENTSPSERQRMEYEENPEQTKKQEKRWMEYEENPNPSERRTSESELNPNQAGKQEKHTLKLEENTSGETFQPKRQKNKVDNLSLRWSKRQPTKNELVEHFMELKSTTVIQQNSVLLMERRIVTLETDLRDLIEYINAKNV